MEALVFVVAVIAVIALAVLLMSHLFRDRWGIVRETSITAGDSPYREGPVTSVKLRGVPKRVRFAAALALAWALATILVFAPAGCLFALISLDQPKLALGGLVVGALSCEGFLFGGSLVVAAVRLMRGALREDTRVNPLATWSILHHVAVAAVFFVLAALTMEVEAVFAWIAFVSVPCAIGIGQILHFSATAKDVAAIRLEIGAGPELSPTTAG
jgi:hypothetical protein